MSLPSIKSYFNLTDEQENKLTRQQDDILMYIYRHGSITPMEAFHELEITKLSTRVSEMDAMGIHLDRKYESGKNRCGRNIRYMRYRRAAA